MIVYTLTNKVNSKVYVGITIQSLKTRVRSHVNTARRVNKTYIHKALNKYGIDGFVVEELDQANSLLELKQKEIFWIDKLNTTTEGYNITLGGDGCNGYNIPKNTKSI